MQNKIWIVTLIVGLIMGWFLNSSDPEIKEIETVVVNETVEYIHDTLYVKIESEIIAPSVPDLVQPTAHGLVRSEKTFETKFADIKVSALAECPVELFTIELLNIKPMRVEIQHELRTIEKIKTVVIEPSWYETRTTGIIIGVAGTLTLVWAAGQVR